MKAQKKDAYKLRLTTELKCISYIVDMRPLSWKTYLKLESLILYFIEANSSMQASLVQNLFWNKLNLKFVSEIVNNSCHKTVIKFFDTDDP